MKMFWGVIEAIKENQVNVRSRTVLTGFIDVFSPISNTKTVSPLIQVGDTVLVLVYDRIRIALVGTPTKNLEVEEGTLEEIIFSDKNKIKITDKSVEISGFEEVTLNSTKSITVNSAKISLGSSAKKAPVVTCASVCSYTGVNHLLGSAEVEAGGG